MKRLVLIDGFAIIHRAYHALPSMTTRTGQPVNAVYGFTSMLLRIIDELKPDYLIVAFDLPEPTFRRELYLAYQANRPYTEEALAGQFSLVREVVEAAGIPVMAVSGFEADDVIGTLARQAVKLRVTNKSKGKAKDKEIVDEVIIITGDRDMMQLVNKKVKLYMPIKGLSEAKLFDEDGVKDYLGIIPQEVIDYKGLVGDSSDNYPGVSGVGPKTALTLLEKYGTLENIYDALNKESGVSNVEDLPEKLRQKLIEGHEGALLSKKLATIVTNVPTKLDLKQAKIKDFKKSDKFIKKLEEFQFKSLIARVGRRKIDEKKVVNRIGKIKQDNGQMGLI